MECLPPSAIRGGESVDQVCLFTRIEMDRPVNLVRRPLYMRPTLLGEAVAALQERPWSILAGGTAFYSARIDNPLDEDVLDISAVNDARAITKDGDDWRIPMLATWSDLIANRDMSARFDGLRKAAREIGSIQIQNVATVCGNLCNASPKSDGIPNLLALDARVELRSVDRMRLLPVVDFVTGDRHTTRAPNELVTAVVIADPERQSRSAFAKLGVRKYLAISIVMIAAVLELDGDQRIAAARFVVGACGPIAVRLLQLEQELLGEKLRGDLAELVFEHHLAPLNPIDDIWGTATYRRDAALTLLRRTLVELSR
jgi:CO/xanthine dehydrogenase FAD-binding subunit